MKRSEMIQIALKRYKEEYCKPFEELGYNIPKLTPSEVGWILKVFEENGMLPPDNGQGYYSDAYAEECNEWEPE